jgi:hypothetical protein
MPALSSYISKGYGDQKNLQPVMWNHGKTPSLGGETGGFYLILGAIELSAA